ncbi:hypothetical protein PVL29_012710 [Vitis rotundifolia]|uniref:Uncharacterized protein n=1 Tax=Vitis rotundifolia TaxID=103349 RepID=A0AA38ZJE9_VITRO|nr:hypothetical protein PVL29_012710 [Vitis rotundifolia]
MESQEKEILLTTLKLISTDAYTEVYDVMTLKRSSQSYFIFSPVLRTLKKPRP